MLLVVAASRSEGGDRAKTTTPSYCGVAYCISSKEIKKHTSPLTLLECFLWLLVDYRKPFGLPNITSIVSVIIIKATIVKDVFTI